MSEQSEMSDLIESLRSEVIALHCDLAVEMEEWKGAEEAENLRDLVSLLKREIAEMRKMNNERINLK
jgi:hypothetical protein